MHYTYRLQSINNPRKIHLGVTRHLKRKVLMHNKGEVAHTAQDAPYRLTFYAAFTRESRAEAFATWLKTPEGHAFGGEHLWHGSVRKKTETEEE